VGLRTLDHLGEIADSTVFVRVDFNVPMSEGAIADDSRIRASLATIRELRAAGALLVLASHLGRPNGAVVEALRLAPIGERLADILDEPVIAIADPAPDAIPPAPVVLLENLRFDPGEEANDVGFAGRLAALADSYVDDAFGAAHRHHASVEALPDLMIASGRPAVSGRLMQREVDVLSSLARDPARPYVAILGGAKVSDKLGVIASLIDRVDVLLIGGAMASTVIAARGGEVAESLVERDRFDDVRDALAAASARGVLVEVPLDVVAADAISADVETRTVSASEIPRGLMALDIGPRTVARFAELIADAKTILWNGPMGVFELAPFAAGTRGIATAVAAANAFTVVGGGDSLLAVREAGVQDRFDHLSTGGGASLEFLEGRRLPGIEIVEDRGRP
jgi:phosphoglycerate kinase